MCLQMLCCQNTIEGSCAICVDACCCARPILLNLCLRDVARRCCSKVPWLHPCRSLHKRWWSCTLVSLVGCCHNTLLMIPGISFRVEAPVELPRCFLAAPGRWGKRDVVHLPSAVTGGKGCAMLPGQATGLWSTICALAALRQHAVDARCTLLHCWIAPAGVAWLGCSALLTFG
jgi:hypothetical protein